MDDDDWIDVGESNTSAPVIAAAGAVPKPTPQPVTGLPKVPVSSSSPVDASDTPGVGIETGTVGKTQDKEEENESTEGKAPVENPPSPAPETNPSQPVETCAEPVQNTSMESETEKPKPKEPEKNNILDDVGQNNKKANRFTAYEAHAVGKRITGEVVVSNGQQGKTVEVKAREEVTSKGNAAEVRVPSRGSVTVTDPLAGRPHISDHH